MLETFLRGYQYVAPYLTALFVLAKKSASAIFVAFIYLMDSCVQIILKIGLLVGLDCLVFPYLLFKSIGTNARMSWDNSAHNASLFMRIGLVSFAIVQAALLWTVGLVLFNVFWMISSMSDLNDSIFHGVINGWTLGFESGLQKLNTRIRLGFKLEYNHIRDYRFIEHLEVTFFDAFQRIARELNDIFCIEWRVVKLLELSMGFSSEGAEYAEHAEQIAEQIAERRSELIRLTEMLDRARTLLQRPAPETLQLEQFKQMKLSDEALNLIIQNHQRLSLDEIADLQRHGQPQIQAILAKYKELTLKIEEKECPISRDGDGDVLLFKQRYHNDQWVLDLDAVPSIFNEVRLQAWCVDHHAIHPLTRASFRPLSAQDTIEGAERYQYHLLQQNNLLVSEHLNQLTTRLKMHLSSESGESLSVASHPNGIFSGGARTGQRIQRCDSSANDDAVEQTSCHQ